MKKLLYIALLLLLPLMAEGQEHDTVQTADAQLKAEAVKQLRLNVDAESSVDIRRHLSEQQQIKKYGLLDLALSAYCSTNPMIIIDGVRYDAEVFVDGKKATRADLDILESIDSVFYRVYEPADARRLRVHFDGTGIVVFCTKEEERKHLEKDERAYIRAILSKPSFFIITGFVVDEQNTPMNDVIVNVMPPLMQNIISVKTDSTGFFQYKVMKQVVGTILSISHDGYKYQYMQIKEEPQEPIRIVLHPIVQPVPSNLPSPIPAPALDTNGCHHSNLLTEP